MRQFTLTQLLMGVWLAAIVLGLMQSGDLGWRFTKVSDLAFSPDGEHLAVVRQNSADPKIMLIPKESRTISILSIATGGCVHALEHETRRERWESVSHFSCTRKCIAYGPEGKSLLVQEFGGSAVKAYDLESEQCTNLPGWMGLGGTLAVNRRGTRAVLGLVDGLVLCDVP